MKLPTGIQEALITLLCFDATEGAIVAGLVAPIDFDPVYKEVAELCLDYRNAHKEAPGEHTQDIFECAAERHETFSRQFERLFDSVQATNGTINARYVVDRARKFVRYQTTKRALASAVRALDKGTEEALDEAESILIKATKPDVELMDPGTFFIHDVKKSLAFLDSPDETFKTGIKTLDELNLGPTRQRLGMLIAPPKAGKSWWLLQLALTAQQYGLRVLYASLELSEAEFCGRMVQSMFSMTKRQVERVGYRRFRETVDVKDWGTDFDTKWLRNIKSLDIPQVQDELPGMLRRFENTERLLVKSFPTRSLSTEGLEAYMDGLEHRQNFIPDLVLVDYGDIMKRPKDVAKHEALQDIGQHLRRIGQERNMAINTVSQVKVEGASARRIDVDHTAGAWGKVADADTVLTLSQTEAENRNNLVRLFIAAARTDVDRVEILISQALEIGHFSMDSIRLGTAYADAEQEGGS